MTDATKTQNDPNLDILTNVARALGDMCDSLVFIGGCAAGLLLTAAQAHSIRITEDVDVVAQVSSQIEYHAIEENLRSRGFANDCSEGAPIGRFVREGIKLDLMPSQPGILPCHNRWYPVAVRTAQTVTLPSGITLRLITGPAFVATKLEAFNDRGNQDYLASHDLEDIVTVVDGRPELPTEARSSPAELRGYLASEFQALLGRQAFVDSLAAHLPGDEASQARLPILLERIRELARLA